MEEAVEERFPEFLGFLLDNPIRRFLEKPGEKIKKWGLIDGRVLEVGCGPGFFSIPLAENNRAVVSFDVSSKFLRRACGKAKEKKTGNINFLRCEASKIPLKGGIFDWAFVHAVYHEINNRDDFIAELARLLKSDGMVVMVEFEPAAGIGKFFGPPGVASDMAELKFKVHFKRIEVHGAGGRRYLLKALK